MLTLLTSFQLFLSSFKNLRVKAISHANTKVVESYTLGLLDMPDEVLQRILKHLPKLDMFWSAGLTCKRLLAIACELNNVVEIDEENKLLGDNEIKRGESQRVDQLFEWKEVAASLTHLIFPNETSWKFCNQIFQEIMDQTWEEIGIVVIFKIKSVKTKAKVLANIGDYCTSVQGLYITSYSSGEIHQMDEVIGKVSNNSKTLKALNLQGCYDITDASLIAIARNCKELSSLNVTWMYQFRPKNVTQDSINRIARECHGLTELHLNQHMYAFMQRDDETNMHNFQHFQINDVIKNVTQECRRLRKLHLIYTSGVNDLGIRGMAKHCQQLEELNLTGCVQITDSGFKSIADHCQRLTSLVVSWCGSLTDVGLMYIAERCRKLKILNLDGCRMITDYGLIRAAENCVELLCLDISHCLNISQSGLELVVERSLVLRELRLKQCTQIFVHDIIDRAHKRCRIWW